MAKQNCWEFMKCGREPGGVKADELGVCPAAIFGYADGFRGGKNAGRACMYITGTFCDETIQGTHLDKNKKCTKCGFYKQLIEEEGYMPIYDKFIAYIKERNGTVQ